ARPAHRGRAAARGARAHDRAVAASALRRPAAVLAASAGLEAARRRSMRTLAGAVAAIALIAPAHAGAETRAQVRALARAAQTSPEALARLRAVRRVGGRPVNLGRALDTDAPAELRARLRALAATGEGGPRQAQAGRTAHSILSGRRFRGSSVPRPFHGFLVWL